MEGDGPIKPRLVLILVTIETRCRGISALIGDEDEEEIHVLVIVAVSDFSNAALSAERSGSLLGARLPQTRPRPGEQKETKDSSRSYRSVFN